MFDKLKQISQMKGISNEIKNEKVEIEKQGVKIVVRGDFTMDEIILNPELDTSEQEKIIKELFNSAVKELQMRMAKKMMGMGM